MAIYGHMYGLNMATNLNKGPYTAAVVTVAVATEAAAGAAVAAVVDWWTIYMATYGHTHPSVTICGHT